MKNQIGTIILVSLVVAIVVSVATVLVMRASSGPSLSPATVPYYTKAEVNSLLAGKTTNQGVLSVLNKAAYYDRFSGNCNSFCNSVNKICFTAGFKYTLSGNSYQDNGYTMMDCGSTLEQLKQNLINLQGNRTVDSRLLCGCA